MTAIAAAATIATSIHSAIAGANFGHPTARTRCAHHDRAGVDSVHDLSQRFVLAAPMGGGAMLAIHALNSQSRTCRSVCD